MIVYLLAIILSSCIGSSIVSEVLPIVDIQTLAFPNSSAQK